MNQVPEKMMTQHSSVFKDTHPWNRIVMLVGVKVRAKKLCNSPVIVILDYKNIDLRVFLSILAYL